MRVEDCNKTPNGRWIYLRFGQRLKSAAHKYSRFTNTVFGHLPKVENIPQMPNLIGIRKEYSFGVYMDDRIGAAKTFEAMYAFLPDCYFQKVVFGPVYLSGKKTKTSVDTLELVGFEGSRGGLRPNQIQHPLVEKNLMSFYGLHLSFGFFSRSSRFSYETEGSLSTTSPSPSEQSEAMTERLTIVIVI